MAIAGMTPWYARSVPIELDPRAEAAGTAHGGRLAHVAGSVEQRDAVQDGDARPPAERLDQAGPEAARGHPALEVGRLDVARPVAVLERAYDLARALADRVAILAESGHVDRGGERGDFVAGHPDAEVPARDVEPLEPCVV